MCTIQDIHCPQWFECFNLHVLRCGSNNIMFLCCSATPLRIEHFSVFKVSAHSQRICSAFAVSPSTFAVESPRSKIFSTGSKIFQFAAQSPWSRTAVSMSSLCIRHQIDGDCAANPRRLQYDSGECMETALQIILGITEMT